MEFNIPYEAGLNGRIVQEKQAGQEKSKDRDPPLIILYLLFFQSIAVVLIFSYFRNSPS
jgi:hypothetical protein